MLASFDDINIILLFELNLFTLLPNVRNASVASTADQGWY